MNERISPRDVLRPPPLSNAAKDAAIARIVAAASRAPQRRWRALLALGLPAIAAVTGTILVLGIRYAEPPIARPVVTDASGVMTWPDGSRVTVDPGGDVRERRDDEFGTALLLTRGAALFEVSHGRTRSFEVEVGGFRIVVLGARFRAWASAGDQAAGITLLEGAAEVRRADLARIVLGPGDSWTAADPSPAGARDPQKRTSSLPTDERHNRAVARKFDVQPHAPPSNSRASSGSRDPAAEMFAKADRARLAGDVAAAARLLDEVRTVYRRSPVAGLAAFALGRLRLGPLGDPPGALDALQDALLLAPDLSYREDCEARLVEALARIGAVQRCRRARDGYLERYPAGAHRAEVSAHCR